MTQTGLRRTRFAPSPTGFMHIGNLRSALYAWLISKRYDGTFILRIEDTDRERLVEGAVEVIYRTLKQCGLTHDEGPDIGGPVAPYVQSERLSHYRPHAERLVAEGKAYYCFCNKNEQDESEEEQDEKPAFGYDRHCRNLSAEEVKAALDAGKPYVIRQRMPLEGTTTFNDVIYGKISVENKELEDQILLKSDGFPTYNFANVVDDHEMGITHVVRGAEYLSSAPKYTLLYESFGWEVPEYVHLPLILGMDGKKLSKRHGATSFEDLVAQGYLIDAIINYIAFLGWAPGQETRELFTLDELRQIFSEDHISKAGAVFDYQKLDWFNEQYIRAMSPEDFANWVRPECEKLFAGRYCDFLKLFEILQPRLIKRAQIAELTAFLRQLPPFDLELYFNKKNKLDPSLCLSILQRVNTDLSDLAQWNEESLHSCLMALPEALALKTGQVMAPPRLALSGQAVTPGGAIEIALILGREESMRRIKAAIAALEEAQSKGNEL